MENNVAIATSAHSSHFHEEASPEGEFDTRLRRYLELLQDAVNSPRTQLILRNTILTLLMLPDHAFTPEIAFRLVTEEPYRTSVVRQLTETAPAYWSDAWNNVLQVKEAEPMSSKAQQRIVRLTALKTFWSSEWKKIPSDEKKHVAEIFRRMGG